MDADAPASNRLAGEASPYLRRLGAQPVSWYPWGAEAFERAAGEDRMILVSAGSYCSYDCLVADAYFDDPELSQQVDREFVAIKVDREERPDVDRLLRDLAGELGVSPAYPLAMLLTPEAEPVDVRTPLLGDTAASYLDWISSRLERWKQDPEGMRRRGAEAEERRRRAGAVIAGAAPVDHRLLQRGLLALQAEFDGTNGGFGDSPRHPQPARLEYLLRCAARGTSGAASMLQTTLEKMAAGGIYDHLGGGFHHVSVDRSWRVPRFEKLLVDNALLARVYTHAWQHFQREEFSRVAQDTLEYLLRDLAEPAGAFFAGQAAYSGDAEGAYYTWGHAEFDTLAPGMAGEFSVTPEGNFRGGTNVLSRSGDGSIGATRAALLKARSSRPAPPRDEKIITSWNGLAIGSLAEAGAAFDRLDLVEAARRAAGTVLARNRQMATGRLWHTRPDDAHAVPGMLDDYAYLAEGLYTLWEVTFEPEWITACEQICRRMIDDFWDEQQAGLCDLPAGQDPRVGRSKVMQDGIAPAGASVAAVVLSRLGLLTGNRDYSRRARKIVEGGVAGAAADLGKYAGLLVACDSQVGAPVEIVVLGPVSDRRTRQLRREIWTRYLPNKVCAGAPPLIPFPLLEGKEPVGGAPTVYVARGGVTKPAVLEPEDFETALKFWAPPSASQVKRAIELLDNMLRRTYLFENLQNPAWVEPLSGAGLFDGPPRPSLDTVEGTVKSPPWPQSRYLARMAAYLPEVVSRTALGVPEVDNPQVHEDLADVALAVPAHLAAPFVKRARAWLDSPYLLHLPEKLGSLVVGLADSGQVALALELAEVLLTLRPEDPAQTRQPVWMPPEPRCGFSRFAYETILTDGIPVLARRAPFAALDLVAGALSRAIELSFEAGDLRAPADDSHLWRPAIHEHEQNADKTLRNDLVSALVEIVESIAREDPSQVAALVTSLERRPWHVFRRIALHLLRVWPEVSEEALQRRLSDRNLFADPHFHHEYLLLARDHFDQLEPHDQERILGWIDRGPDLALWESDPDLGSQSGGPGDYADRWRLDRLEVLREFLPEDRRPRYAELTQRFGVPANPDFVTFVPGTRQDPTTPIQAEELHEMDVRELVEFLATWRPAPGLGNPTAEGMARKLAAVVATEPARFGDAADRFKGLDARYVWAMLQGLREASEGFEFEWQPVLALAEWAAGVDPQGDAGRWRPARLEVARLVSRGLGQGKAQIPYWMRERVWKAIEPLTEDPDPVGREVQDPLVDSLSTVRGEAMHAVFRYALWVRREIETSEQATHRLARGFDEMPEVRRVLEHHLNPANDEALAVRSVYGRYFSYLLMLDGAWTSNNLRRIFPLEPDLAPFRAAAWQAHVSFSSPYDHLLSVIEEEYRLAVERVSSYSAPSAGIVPVEHRLAEHLMVFYLRGKLALDRGGLLGRFFSDAPDQLRRHALSFIGRSLKNQAGLVPRDVAMRIRALWERRLKTAGQAQTGDFAAELSAFGWWFASGKLEGAWSLSQLRALLEMGVRVEPVPEVVGRLNGLEATSPEVKVEVLKMLLDHERENPNLPSLAEDARSIVNDALGSGDDRARTTALEVLRFFDVSEIEDLVRWDQ